MRAPGPGTRVSRCTPPLPSHWNVAVTRQSATSRIRSSPSDLGRIDLMVALDRRHRQMLLGLGADPDRLVLLRSFDKSAGAAADVPDPYYGDQTVFDECRDMIAVACTGLVALLAANWDSLWAA